MARSVVRVHACVIWSAALVLMIRCQPERQRWALLCLRNKRLIYNLRIMRLIVRYGSSTSLEKKTINLLYSSELGATFLWVDGVSQRPGRGEEMNSCLSSGVEMSWRLPGGGPSESIGGPQPNLPSQGSRQVGRPGCSIRRDGWGCRQSLSDAPLRVAVRCPQEGNKSF